MVININGYKRWVRKCHNRNTYGNNLRILCQGTEDNPLHTDAFNELIENLKKKSNMEEYYGFNYERSVRRTLFMEENRDGIR